MIRFGSCRLLVLYGIAIAICLTVAPLVRGTAERVEAGGVMLPLDGGQSPTAPGGPVHAGGGLERWCELPGSEANKRRAAAPLALWSSLPAADDACDAARTGGFAAAFHSLRQPIGAATLAARPRCLRI